MPNPIEWKEADRTETKTIPGANARLVVRRTRAPGSHPDGTPRAACTVDDATPADLASALGTLPAGERAQVLQAFGSDPEIRAALLADCAVAHGRAAVSEAVANETRKERVAAEAERDEARKERDALRIDVQAYKGRLADVERERDAAAARARNHLNGAAGLRDALATMRKERDEARDQCAQATATVLAEAQAELDAARRAQVVERANARNDRIAAEYRLRVTAAERDAARAESATLRQGRDVAHAQLVTELERVRELATELDRMRAERDEARDATAQAEAAAADARKERDALRTELRAREWLAAKGCASRPVFVQYNGVAFAYASYAVAARALGWEG